MRIKHLFVDKPYCLVRRACLPAVMFTVIGSSSGFASDAINWQSLDSGIDAAKQSHKMIMVDLYTDWCQYCKKLDQTTYTDQSLINYLNDKFVCIKENAETEKVGKTLKTAYHSDGYPTILVFDESGTFLGKIDGCANASNYKMFLEGFIKTPVKGDNPNLVSLINDSQNSKTSTTAEKSDEAKSTADSSQSEKSTASDVKRKIAPTIKSLIGRFY